MDSPGKEEYRGFLSRKIEGAEVWINRFVSSRSPSTVLLYLIGTGVWFALLVALFLHFTSGSTASVGSISTPTVFEEINEKLGDRTPLDLYHEARSSQAFLDSVDRFGIERMEEIYQEKLKPVNYE